MLEVAPEDLFQGGSEAAESILKGKSE